VSFYVKQIVYQTTRYFLQMLMQKGLWEFEEVHFFLALKALTIYNKY